LDHAETADLKAGDLDRALEDSGIRLRSTLEAGGFTWRLLARGRDQDRALGLLADRVLRTVFDPALLESQRSACRRQEEGLERSPRARLLRALLQDPSSRPTAQSLGAITLADLVAFRTRVFRPGRAVLLLHGDLSLEQAKRLVLLNLGSWVGTGAAPPGPPASTPTPANPLASPERPSRIAIPAPGQGLRVQVLAPEPAGLAPETAALLNLLLPGEAALAPVLTSSKEGCLVATLDGPAGLSGTGAWQLLRGRLDNLRRQGFSQVDLKLAQAAWSARRSLDSLHPEAQLDAALAEALGRGAAPERIQALGLEALNAGLRRWLDPGNLREGAAGDPELLKEPPTP
jgi:hypothetical protein